jgi:hypothetical protein
MSVAGSVRKFTIEGISYDVAADANISRKPTKVDNDMIPTSGVGMRKITRVTPKAEAIDLLVNSEEMEQIKSFAEDLENVKVDIETADGTVHRCVGAIQVDAHETEENKATVVVLPEDDWTTFPA